MLYKYMRLEPLTKKAIQAIGEGKTINEYLDSQFKGKEKKYCNLSSSHDQALYAVNELLFKKNIYFHTCNDQNDLFENIALIDEASHVKARFSMLDQDAIKRDSKWPQKAKKQKKLIRKQLLNRRPDAFENGKKYWVYRVIQSNNGMVDYPGICSFTSSYDNCYMWSHYASSNKGICIGFSGFKYEYSKEQGKSTTKILSHDPPIILSEVNYLPLLIIEQSNTKGLWEQFNIENPRTNLLYGQFIDHAVICHKNPVYEHEKEWRLISSRPNISVTFNSFSDPVNTHCIIFGAKSEIKMRNWLIKSYQNLTYKLLDLDLSRKKYQLKLLDYPH